MKQNKKKYATSAHKDLTQTEWLALFKKIEERRNISEIAHQTGIRRQLLSEKYNLWKRYGNDYLFCKTWSNRIFTQEEECELFMEIWNYDYSTDKKPKFCDLIIEKLAAEFYCKVSKKRAVKPFKVSLGWIIEFRRRFGIKFKASKSYYLQWEIVQPRRCE